MKHSRAFFLSLGVLLIASVMIQTAQAELPRANQIWPRFYYCGFEQAGAEGLVTTPPGAWGLGNGDRSLEVEELASNVWALAWVENGFGWTDHILQASVQYKGGEGNELGLVYRLQDPDNFYLFTLNDGASATLSLCVNGAIVRSESAAFAYSSDQWYVLRVEAQGDLHSARINGVEVIAWTDNTFQMGTGGLAARGTWGWFDNVFSISRPGGAGNGGLRSSEHQRLMRRADAITRRAYLEAAAHQVRLSDPGRLDAPETLPPNAGLTVAGANPFRHAAVLHLALDQELPASIRVHDASGRCVRTLLQGVLPPGERSVVWDGRTDDGSRAAAGVYFCTLRTPTDTQTRRLIMSR